MTVTQARWMFVALLGTAAMVAAQEASPAFEVVAIRQLEKPAFRAAVIGATPGGRFVATNASLYSLIAHAYAIVSPQHVEGGPAWAQSDRFDIEARSPVELKSGGSGVVGLSEQMLQRLLAERFGLRLHVERRPKAAFALVVARTDGTLGPQMSPLHPRLCC